MDDGLPQYRGCGGIRGHDQAIVHPAALSARCHDAGPAKISQMTRNLGLADSQNIDKVADADFLIGDEVQQT